MECAVALTFKHSISNVQLASGVFQACPLCKDPSLAVENTDNTAFMRSIFVSIKMMTSNVF